MAFVNVRFTVLGEEQLNRGIAGVIDATSDLTPAFQEIAEDFRETEEKQFAGEGAYGGNTRWADLNPDYAAIKLIRWGNLPILTRTGDLRKSLSEKSHSEHIEEIEKMSMTIGTSIPYAIYHQTGTQWGKRKMPARPPIRMTDRQKRKWGSIVRRSLQIDLKTAQGKYYKSTVK